MRGRLTGRTVCSYTEKNVSRLMSNADSKSALAPIIINRIAENIMSKQKFNLRIYRDFAMNTTNILVYYEKEDGTRRYAKPVVFEINDESQEPSAMVQPTVVFDTGYFDLAIDNDLPKSDKELLLKQKDSDKNYHIDNLNKIIEKIIK